MKTLTIGYAHTGLPVFISPVTNRYSIFGIDNWASPFMNAGFHPFLMPIMQGFVGQRHFIVKKNFQAHTHTEAFNSLEGVLNADQMKAAEKQSRLPADCQQPFLLTLISRRSTQRSGLRYLRRGIDDRGNCANTVETEQILSSPTWERSAKYRCFVQIRGSIPLYFSQSPYAFKPVPILHQSWKRIKPRSYDTSRT